MALCPASLPTTTTCVAPTMAFLDPVVALVYLSIFCQKNHLLPLFQWKLSGYSIFPSASESLCVYLTKGPTQINAGFDLNVKVETEIAAGSGERGVLQGSRAASHLESETRESFEKIQAPDEYSGRNGVKKER